MDVRPTISATPATSPSTESVGTAGAGGSAASTNTYGGQLPAGFMARRALLTSPERRARQITPILAAGLRFPSMKEGSITERADAILGKIHSILTDFKLPEARATFLEGKKEFPPAKEEDLSGLNPQQRSIVVLVNQQMRKLEEQINLVETEEADTSLRMLAASLEDFKLEEAKEALRKIRELFPAPTLETLETLSAHQRAQLARVDEKALAQEGMIERALKEAGTN